MVIDNKGKLPLHLVGQSASQKNRGKSEDIKKLLKSKMPEDDDEGGAWWCCSRNNRRALSYGLWLLGCIMTLLVENKMWPTSGDIANSIAEFGVTRYALV